MGQKVNPNGFRVGVIRDWNTHWFAAKKDFADCLVEDRKIRDFVKKKYYQASISRIVVDRATGKISVGIYTARPGMLIGKGGAGIEEIKAAVAKEIGKPVSVNKGHQAHLLRSSRRRGNRPLRRISRRFHSAADDACGYPLRLCRGEHPVRSDRLQSLDLQGRSAEESKALGRRQIIC